ncbi:MAG: hypothetical protein R3B09_30880 [Nannocystaceae bacterium]
MVDRPGDAGPPEEPGRAALEAPGREAAVPEGAGDLAACSILL